MATACTNGLDTGFVDLGYMKVAVLGVVQGITELLPISSTAHMRIVPALLGWKDPGSAFSAAMQLAALAAVVSYFWSDIRALAEGSVRALVRRDFNDWTFRFVVWIALATVPIGIAGLALSGSTFNLMTLGGLALDNCEPLQGDGTAQVVSWTAGAFLQPIGSRAGQPVPWGRCATIHRPAAYAGATRDPAPASYRYWPNN